MRRVKISQELLETDGMRSRQLEEEIRTVRLRETSYFSSSSSISSSPSLAFPTVDSLLADP